MEPVRSFCKDSLAVRIYADRTAMGAAAARDGAALLRRLLAQQDTVRAVFAAAPSQNEFLGSTVRRAGYRLETRYRIPHG